MHLGTFSVALLAVEPPATERFMIASGVAPQSVMAMTKKILVSVAIAGMLGLGIWMAVSSRSESHVIERVLGDVGVPDEDLARIERLMKLEHRRLEQHPAYQKFMETDPEVEKWKGHRGPGAVASGLAASERLKSAGLPMLGAEDLAVVNQIQSRMASVSSDLCVQMWTGGDQGLLVEVVRALSKLTDDEVREWLRVSVNAQILALEAPKEQRQTDDNALMAGFQAIGDALEPADVERYWTTFDATVEWAENSGPRVDDADACFMTMTILRGSAALEEPLRTRFWRAYLAAQGA